jgi:hypothetical protein
LGNRIVLHVVHLSERFNPALAQIADLWLKHLNQFVQTVSGLYLFNPIRSKITATLKCNSLSNGVNKYLWEFA